jgi:Flagellar motor protein
MSDVSLAETDHHAEEDENYFISMTDMMVGILFVFIILLMVFAMNFRQQTDTSEDRIKRLEQVATTASVVQREISRLQEQVEEEIAAAAAAAELTRELLEQLRDRLQDEGLAVEVDFRSGVLRLGEDAINFAVNSAALDAVAAANVDKLAAALVAVLPQYTPEGGEKAAYVETVFIEGHTDRSGTAELNWQLSTARAVNTFWRLVQQQPYLQELKNRAGTPVLSAAGYADSRPIPGVDPNEYDRHRRIDLRFVLDADTSQRLKDVMELTEKMQRHLDQLQKAVDEANAH